MRRIGHVLDLMPEISCLNNYVVFPLYLKDAVFRSTGPWKYADQMFEHSIAIVQN